MNSFALYTYKYQDKDYDFVPSRNARIAIEDLELNAFDGISNLEILGSVMGNGKLESRMNELNGEINKAKEKDDYERIAVLESERKIIEDKINDSFGKLLPYVKDVTKSQRKTEDQYEIAKLILTNYKGNGEVTNALADEILEDMELTLGSEKFEETLLEIADKVFTQMKKIQDHKVEIFKKAKEAKGSMLPMS